MSEWKPVFESRVLYVVVAILSAAITLAADAPWWVASIIAVVVYFPAEFVLRRVRDRRRRAAGRA